MDLTTHKGNLFSAYFSKGGQVMHGYKYALAHCISADAAMGKGIAVDFTNYFPAVKRLRNMDLEVGKTYFVSPVYNIVTKRKYCGKPTYQTMEAALFSLREQIVNNNHTHLMIPKIGCGLDGLSWPRVQELLVNIFFGDEIKIEVYHI